MTSVEYVTVNGAIYECGCADIPEGDCDCDGNQPDDGIVVAILL